MVNGVWCTLNWSCTCSSDVMIDYKKVWFVTSKGNTGSLCQNALTQVHITHIDGTLSYT